MCIWLKPIITLSFFANNKKENIPIQSLLYSMLQLHVCYNLTLADYVLVKYSKFNSKQLSGFTVWENKSSYRYIL